MVGDGTQMCLTIVGNKVDLVKAFGESWGGLWTRHGCKRRACHRAHRGVVSQSIFNPEALQRYSTAEALSEYLRLHHINQDQHTNHGQRDRQQRLKIEWTIGQNVSATFQDILEIQNAADNLPHYFITSNDDVVNCNTHLICDVRAQRLDFSPKSAHSSTHLSSISLSTSGMPGRARKGNI
jgi:hypothetical protein